MTYTVIPADAGWWVVTHVGPVMRDGSQDRFMFNRVVAWVLDTDRSGEVPALVPFIGNEGCPKPATGVFDTFHEDDLGDFSDCDAFMWDFRAHVEAANDVKAIVGL